MKRFIAFVLAGLALLVYAAGRQNPSVLSRAVESGDIVRLHVIANSDSERDQSIKLMVRDAVLEVCGASIEGADSAARAKRAIERLLPDIEKAARATARAQGFKGEVAAYMGRFEFPERVYGGEVVPAGQYDALRVVLGAGEGHNWWCVMYPPLCLVDKDGNAAKIGDSVRPVKDVKFQSTLAEWFKKLKNRPEYTP